MSNEVNKWFVCSVAADESQPGGTIKKVTNMYLVNAFSFAEAEERITAELSPYIVGEFEVKAVKAERFAEMFENADGDKWYKARLSFITIDEKTGAEKKARQAVYARASSLNDAVYAITQGMKGTMSDWEFFSITETPILDVYK